MFRFTIRELLLLTVIVGLAVAWGLRERQLNADLETRTQERQRWQRRCEGIKRALAIVGGNASWNDHSVRVVTKTENGGTETTVNVGFGH